MAQSAKGDVEAAAGKAASNVSEIGKRVADKSAEVARETADKVEKTVERGAQVARRTADASVEASRAVGQHSADNANQLSQAFAELASEQSRHAFATFRALTTTRDWSEAAKIQGDFVRTSVERMMAFGRSYIEMLQGFSSTAIAATKKQADKAMAES